MPIISPKIPSGLEELMRGLAKSVIKENPQNIYEFAADYFENLLRERDGSCDQSYKKFATYKVYKKNKNARLKREKENTNDVNDNNVRKDGIPINYGNQNVFEKTDSFGEKSIEECILPSSTQQPLQSLPKSLPSISSESEINAIIREEPSPDIEGAPSPVNNSEDDDIKNMVLDEDMEQAALKIQSTFRGHKTRKAIKDSKLDDENTEQVRGETDTEIIKRNESEDNENVGASENNESDLVEGSADENPNDDMVESEHVANDVKEPLQSEIDDDIANMVLDDDMEQAALKIQSTFRGHKVRREMKGNVSQDDDEKTDAGEEEQENIDVRYEVDESEDANKENENIEELTEALHVEPENAENLVGDESFHEEEITQTSDNIEQEIEENNQTVEEVIEDVIVQKKLSETSLDPETETVEKTSVEKEHLENIECEQALSDAVVSAEVETENAAGEEVEIEKVEKEIVENQSIEKQSLEKLSIEKPSVDEGKEEVVEGETTEDGAEMEDTEVKQLEEASAMEDAEEKVDGEALELENNEKVSLELEPGKETLNLEEDVKPSETEAQADDESLKLEENNDIVETLENASLPKDESVTESVEIQEAASDEQESQNEGNFEANVQQNEISLEEKGCTPSSEQSSAVEEEKLENETQYEKTSEDNAIENVDEPLEPELIEENSLNVEETEKTGEENIENKSEEAPEKLKESEKSCADDENSMNEEKVEIENNDEEKLQREASTVDELLENKENQDECENVIELTETVEANDEKENYDEPKEENEAIEISEDNDEGNELKPQEGLSEMPKESESLNNLQNSATVEDIDYSDTTPVVEELCVKKSVESLGPDEQNADEIKEASSEGILETHEKVEQELGEVHENIVEQRASEEAQENSENVEKGSQNTQEEILGVEKSIEESKEDGLEDKLSESKEESVEKLSEEMDENLHKEMAEGSKEAVETLREDSNDIHENSKISNEASEDKCVDLQETEDIPEAFEDNIGILGDVTSNIEEIKEDLEDIEGDIGEKKEILDEIPSVDKKSLDKLPSNEIEYSVLKESISEQDATPIESIEENDSKSVSEEKSIDRDTLGSKQNSVDENSDDEKETQVETTNESRSTVDDIELNATQQHEQHLNEVAGSEAVESILNSEISPIELMDEIVNECAGAVADEFFSGNFKPEQESDENVPSGNNEEESKSTEIIEPKLNEENPLKEIESKSIDLSRESVQLSADEHEPITDEILQPEGEESEIPEEDQQPMDENIPVVSMEETAFAIENDSENPEEDAEKKSELQPTEIDDDDDVSNMVLDEEMEDAALKIQAAFRGHKVRKEQIVSPNIEQEENVQNNSESSVVIDQCVEENQDNQETPDQDETEQQDTSADVEEIQDSEAVDEGETQEETNEVEENVEDETAIESVENDTTEQAEDDPGASGEASEQQQNDDEDDVANMVLDEEMEQAALKIQSTFRGHKTRKEMKNDEPQGETSTADEPKEQKESVQDIDDDIANMVLDDEMEQAALKIQSTFRGHKTRKEIKKNDEDEEDKEDEESKDQKEEEKEPSKEEEAPQTSSDKTAQQLQDEEDIANIVMDAEMEQTALKIQSVFRRKKSPKDGDDDFSDEDEAEDPDKSDDDPFQSNEMCQDNEGSGEIIDDEKGFSEQSAVHYSSPEGNSIDHQNTSYEYEPLMMNASTDDLNLMQGGGIFPDPSGESADLLTGSSGEDRDPDRNNSSYKKVSSDRSHEVDEPSTVQTKSIESLDDAKVIENFDFDANKDTAEAMYYSLKKNELETQKKFSNEKQLSTDKIDEEQALYMETTTNFENQSLEDDDDVVMMTTELPSSEKRLKHGLKYGMSMDDRLLGSILSQEYSKPRKEGYPDDTFDPVLESTMRNYYFLENLQETSHSEEDEKNMSYDDYPGEDEDQFDSFYNSDNIRQKIMASSFSIADSDYDPTNNKSIIDDDKIRTALETIHSTDSESTIASAATKIHAGERAMGKRNNNNTHSMQYSSIGNAAIDKSLDEFIQSQELRIEQFDEEMEGGYNSPPPRKEESIDEWTDDTVTYTDSDKKVPGVIEIKLEQRTSFLTVDERRRTLHREDAIQRNSTREDEESSKSSNASAEKLLDKDPSPVETTSVKQDSVIDTEIAVPVLDLTAKSKSPSQLQARPHRMKRQNTMPVQIQTDVIRVIPKHLRKRIKSADGDKKKRMPK